MLKSISMRIFLAGDNRKKKIISALQGGVFSEEMRVFLAGSPLGEKKGCMIR